MSRLLRSAERLLSSLAARLVLSILILASLLPPHAFVDLSLRWVRVDHLNRFFVIVFGIEFILRAALTFRRARQRRLKPNEPLVLLLDFLALLSFLHTLGAPSDLRHLRIARLLLLLGYWSGVLRELWTVLGERERRHQFLMVVAVGGVLAFGGAALMLDFGESYDFDRDGQITDRDRSFRAVLWWSFLQIQDSGNMATSLDEPRSVLVVSVLLTLVGLLILSFFIGIGTSLVNELVERSRSQPIALEDHTVILGLTPYTILLLSGLAHIYRKNLRAFRGVVLGDPTAIESSERERPKGFLFRTGDPSRVSDLERIQLPSAKRAIILGDDSADPDASVISAILAARRANPSIPLYPDMEHERNFPAARAAGGPDTHLVGSGSMLGYYIVQNIVYPRVYHLYRHLLQSAGAEIYTYLFTEQELATLRTLGSELSVSLLHRRALGKHRVTLLGLFLCETDEERAPSELTIVLNPVVAARGDSRGPAWAFPEPDRLDVSRLRGLVGLALRFRSLEHLASDVLQRVTHPEASPWPRPESFDLETRNERGEPSNPPALKPDRTADPRKVLILGIGARVPRVVRELIGFFPELTLTVIGDPTDDVESCSHDMLAMLTKAFGDGCELTRDDAGALQIQLNTKARSARITLMAADWTHGHRLQQQGAVTLEAADVLLLIPDGKMPETGADPALKVADLDGRIALDGLHLANLERTGAVRFRPGTHVLALVRDPEKGDLLENRLVAMAGESRACRYTVVSRERARHRFIMQNVFVRGLNAVYLKLLGSQGQHFARLVPTTPNALRGRIEPAQLAERWLHESGRLLIGFELNSDGHEPEVVIDPSALKSGVTLDGSKISAIYVMINRPPDAS